MDTSEQYIKMCEGAKEIQELWDRDEFNNVFVLGDHIMLGSNYNWVENKNWKPLSNMWRYRYENSKGEQVKSNHRTIVHPSGMTVECECWLPRQDQLQEMVWTDLRPQGQLEMAWKWRCDLGKRGYFNRFETMEQFWLALVMHELYEKEWRKEEGEEWRTR